MAPPGKPDGSLLREPVTTDESPTHGKYRAASPVAARSASIQRSSFPPNHWPQSKVSRCVLCHHSSNCQAFREVSRMAGSFDFWATNSTGISPHSGYHFLTSQLETFSRGVGTNQWHTLSAFAGNRRPLELRRVDCLHALPFTIPLALLYLFLQALDFFLTLEVLFPVRDPLGRFVTS